MRLGHCFLLVGSQAIGWLGNIQFVQHSGKQLAILRAFDALRAGAENVHAIGLQTKRKV